MTVVRKLLLVMLLLALAIPPLAAGAETLTTEQKYDVLKSKGIFTGLGDGSAGLNQSMTREQFAAVLFRLWGLTDSSPSQATFDDVLKTRWSFREVEAVNRAGLMKGTGARLFAPEAKVTVEQLAVVLIRAYGYEGTGSARVSGKTSPWARGSVILALDHQFITTQSDYTAAATRGQLVEAAYTAYQQFNANKLQVSTVQPLANSLIQITLKQAVSKVDTSSFSLKDDQGTVIAIRAATLSSDGKIVTVTTGPQQGDVIYTLTVDGTSWRYTALWAGNGGGTTSPGDTTRPTITNLENLGDRTLRLTFSEQINRSTATDPNHYSIADRKLAIHDIWVSDDLRTVTLTTGGQEEGRRYQLFVSGIQDLSGNTMNSRNDLYFYGIDNDHSIPTVVSVNGQNDSTVKIVFSERVDADDAKNTRNYDIEGLRINRATLASDGKTVTLSTSEQKNGQNYKLTIREIADLSGNVMDTRRDIVFQGINDHEKPFVASVSVLGNSTVAVQFNEKINADQARNAGNYSINNGLWVTNAVVDSDGVTVILTTTRQSDAVLYALTVQGISDLAGNTMDKASNLYFGGLVDRDLPSVVGIQNTANQVVLTFSERLDSYSASNAGNYRFEGNLGVVRSAAYDDAKKTVTLTTDTQLPGGVYTLVINQVKDLSGNAIQADTRIQFVGSDREAGGSISLQSLEVVNQNTVQATFSRALFDSNVASLDLTILKDNNRDVDVRDWSEYVTRKPGTDNAVLIQLRTKATGNPSLFVAGHVYLGRITDLEGLATENGANEKVFPGTEKKNDAPYVTNVAALNDTAIKVTFSEPVRNVDPSGFALLRGDDSGIGIGGDNLNDKNRIVTEVTLYLNDELKSGQTYRLRFRDSIKDAAGWNAIRTEDGSGPYQVVFAGTSADNEAPRVNQIMSKDRYTFEIQLSEPVRLEDARGFRLFEQSSGDEVRIGPNDYASYLLSGDRTKITVYLNVDRLDGLKADRRYRLEYDSRAGKITDDQGAALQSSDNSGAFVFTPSGADPARPYIAKVDARGTTIAVAFGEPIIGYSNQTNFLRIEVDGQEVKPSEGWLDGQSIVLKVPALASGKIGKIRYTDAGASSIKDYNHLSPNRDAEFTFGVQ